MSISISNLSSTAYQDIKPPTTPRSLRACFAESIDPNELRYLPESVFKLHELNEYPKKRDNFDHYVRLRHQTHIDTLITDLNRVKRRLKEQKKEALRKLDISRRNKRRILTNKRLLMEAKLGKANEIELQKTLQALGIDPLNPPSWLDLDDDGNISQEELMPLKEMMRKMVVEKKRQERVLKIKLTLELQKVKEMKKEDQRIKEDEKLKKEKSEKENELKKRREEKRVQKKREKDEELKKKQFDSERIAKKQFQLEYERQLLINKRMKKKLLEDHQNLIEKMKQGEKKKNMRKNQRKLIEDERLGKADEKWKIITLNRKKELLLNEELQRQNQLKRKKERLIFEKKMSLNIERCKTTAKLKKKRLDNKLMKGLERSMTASSKRKKRFMLNNQKKKDSIVSAAEYLKRKKERKRIRLSKKEQLLKMKRDLQHRNVMKELESVKFKNMLKGTYKKQSVQRQINVKNNRMNWVDEKTNVKNYRFQKLKQQKDNILNQTTNIRKKMEQRKKKINSIVDQLKIDNNWKPAEKLLASLANGISIDISSSSIKKPRKPPENHLNCRKIKSPRSGRHIVAGESYCGNPYLGFNISDSIHENKLRNIRNGNTPMKKNYEGLPIMATSPHIIRMKRARKWCNLSARKFEKIFGNIKEDKDTFTAVAS
jgi:hypothetical protein